MGIAEPAVAAAQQHRSPARHVQVGEQRGAVLGEDLRADRHLDQHVRRARPGAVRPGTVAALLGAEVLRVAEVDQGVQVLHRFHDDVAALAAVAAVRATELDVFLAAERNDAVAAVAGAQMDLGLVEKLHHPLQ